MTRTHWAIISWTGFIVFALWRGWNGNVFESRALNIAYEAGFVVGGAALLVLIFAALARLLPRRFPVAPWLLLGLLIAGAVIIKFRADDYLQAEPAKAVTSSD